MKFVLKILVLGLLPMVLGACQMTTFRVRFQADLDN
jgi:hypothetical protein